MGLLDGLVGLVQSQGGSEVAAQLAQHLPDVLGQHGIDGVQGLTDKLSQGGLGAQIASWTGSGQNLPVSADQIQQALGSPMVASLAQKFGVDPAQASQLLSQHLPQIIAAFSGNK